MTTPFDRTAASHPEAEHEHEDEAYCSACNKSYSPELTVCPQDGARLTRLKGAKDALLGRVFDSRFEIKASLGQGGMGTVYRAHQLSVDREVAIKVIHPKLAGDRTAVKRFLREARLASRLSQPNIVNVYDFGQTDDGILYLVMELVRGHNLAEELQRGALPLRRVTTIALQLCDALDVAHREGIVHRDLKPGNIVILDDPPGRDLIKVLDFGLAKSLVSESASLTASSNAMLGTPLYMPPEQVEGRPSDHRADLYALGCILFHMLAGVPPFIRETVNLVLSAHVEDPPPPLPARIPAPLAMVVADLLAKDPAARPSSAATVRELIQSLVEGGFAASTTGPPPRPPTSPGASLGMAETAASEPPQTSARAARRTPRWLPLAALGAIAIGGGIALLALGHREPRPSATSIAGSAGSAAPAAFIDAGLVPVANVDAAALAVDASPTHVDAGLRRPPRADAAAIAPAPRDAAPLTVPADAAVPTAIPVDAAPAAPPPKSDAGALPDLPFILPK